MKIKESFKKTLLVISAFFKREVKPTKTKLSKLDIAEIITAFTPMAVFGILLFGMRAVIILLVSVILSLGLDFLWNLIFKKEKKIDYTAAIIGVLACLTLSSAINIFLVLAFIVIITALRKTLFKNSGIKFTSVLLCSRGILAIIFCSAFTTYFVPFFAIKGVIPIDSLYETVSYVYYPKYLFFGIHSGNIGEVSTFLVLLGAIYLIIRRVINPIIPISFITASATLSLIFGENLAVSLLGGGIVFAAFFLTLDYGFKKDILIKKIGYGIACAILTFVIRKILKTEGVYFAILIADFIFICITRKNIKRFIKFIKKPNFKILLNKLKCAFSV